jgi:uncharacterized protein
MRYWRHYPKFLQTILLMLLIFTLASFSFVIANFGINKIYGVTMEAIGGVGPNSGSRLIAATQFLQGITSLFTFLLSALLFAYLCHPKPTEYLGLQKVRDARFLIWVLPLMVFVVPLFAQIGEWMQLIDFGAGAKSNFEDQQKMMKALMSGTSIGSLLLYLLVFAVLPALGEEFLFRGIVMRFAYNNTRNFHFAILFSAAIFGLAHGTVYNFLPIMLAGVLLGYIYYFSGSLWPCIVAHFLNNAMAIVLLFLSNKGIVSKELGEAEGLPWLFLLFALSGFLLIFFLLRKNATPLPSDWNDDFRGERLTH